MLTLLRGRIAEGKTTEILNRIGQRISSKQPSILIVPDHVTYHFEKRLCTQLGLKGFIDVTVTSFNRLASAVIDYCGEGRKTVLDDCAKAMVMRRCIAACEDELKVFRSAAHRKGFSERCTKMISTLENCGYEPEDVTRVLSELPESVLEKKLEDMNRLYVAYRNVLSGGYTDNADRLARAEELLVRYQPLDNAVVFLDGFDVFTSRLYQFITKLLCRCDVVIALSDAMGGDDESAYDIHKKTQEKLLDCAYAAGLRQVDIQYVDIQAQKSTKSPEIDHLKAAFYARTLKTFPGECKNLSLKTYNAPVDEVIAVAEAIVHGVRDKEQRYKDYAVLSGDVNTYSPIIRNIFKRYGVPVYTDVKHDIVNHPVAMYLFSLLKCVLYHFHPDAVSDYLLSNLTNISRDDADRFLAFIQTAGVTGRELEKGLCGKRTKNADAQADFDRVRLEVIPPLQDFASRFLACRTAREMAACCYDFLLEQGVYERINKLVDQYESSKDYDLSDVTAQLWNTVIRLLDDIGRLLGEKPVTPDAFCETLLEGFEVSPVSTIPSVLDCVTFGDLTAARESGVKHVFLIGVNDGVIPAVFSDDRLVTPQESALLTEHGMELAHTADTEDARIRYRVYAAFTQAEETLTVSCPLYSSTGAALRPSRLFKRLEKLFPKLKTKAIAPRTPVEELQEPVTRMQLKWAMAQDRLQSPESKALYAILSAEGDEDASFLDFALRGRETILEPELAKALFAPGDAMSVSRLETFASCPLQHFLEYGLSPEESEEYAVNAADVGNLLHATLEEFVRRAQKSDLSQEESTSLAGEIFDSKLPEAHCGAFTSSGRQRMLNGHLRALACRCAWEIKQQLGEFTPIGEEISFGYGGKEPMTIETSYGTLRFKGKIDRADKAERDGTVYLRIVDYKSSKGITLSESGIQDGTKLQLMMYMNALLARCPGAKPAAVCYMRLFDEDKPYAGCTLDAFDAKGISEERFAELLKTADESAKMQAEDMLSGDIKARDGAKSCPYCRFKPICRKSREEDNDHDEMD